MLSPHIDLRHFCTPFAEVSDLYGYGINLVSSMIVEHCEDVQLKKVRACICLVHYVCETLNAVLSVWLKFTNLSWVAHCAHRMGMSAL